MKKIKLNKNVFEFLSKELTVDGISELMDNAIYYAFQHGTEQAQRCGQQYEEAAVLASKRVAEIIEANFGKIDISGTRMNGESYVVDKNEYCILSK